MRLFPRRRGHPEHDFLKDVRVVLIAVVSWFLLTTGGELIGNQANNTVFGQTIGRYVLVAAAVLVPVALGVWLVLYLRERRREPPELDVDARPPPVLDPPAWQPPDPLYGRDSEVNQALELSRSNGVVAVVGPRDIGTSAVARTVVQRLLDAGIAGRAVRFDLRSRSSRRPDDSRAAAGRIVSTLGLDEPADGTPALLADAGSRMVAAVRERYDVVLLDNVSTVGEVEWLVRQWPPGGPPWLVVAGELALRSLVEHGTVVIGELNMAALQEMWLAELPASENGLRQRIRGWRRGRSSPDLDALLRACFGRPRALKAFAWEVVRPGSTVTVDSLLASINSAGPVDGPLERVWTAILDHARDALPPDAVWLLHALAELPVTGLARDEIAALRGTAGEPLEELRIRNLVRENEGRYRLPTEVRRAVTGTTPEELRREYALEAVPALLAHHARQSTQWSAQLGSRARAVAWFHDAERSLRPLFSRDNYDDDQVLELSIEDLRQIAEALEAWYVREQQPGGLRVVNENLRALAERANRPDVAGVAALRIATAYRIAGEPGIANAKLEVAAAYPSAETEIRVHVERALLCLASPDPDGMAVAEASLRAILDAQPRHPVAATALIDLGALCLYQNRPANALIYLRRAEELATERADTGARAHAVELQGVAVAFDSLPDAVRLWWVARDLFHLVGEEQGEARCLQHLGSAALVDPTVAGDIRDGRPTPLTPDEAAKVAIPLLERSQQLRAGQPGTTLADEYLADATLPEKPPEGS